MTGTPDPATTGWVPLAVVDAAADPASAAWVPIAIVNTTPDPATTGWVPLVPLGRPTITNLSPLSGDTGIPVSVWGTNLTRTMSVTFAGTPATFVVIQDNLVVAYVPPGAASGSVVVTTPAGAASGPNFTTRLPLSGVKLVTYPGPGNPQTGEAAVTFSTVVSDWTPTPLGLEDGQHFTTEIGGGYRVQASVTYPGYGVVGWGNGWSGEFWGDVWVRVRRSGYVVFDSAHQSINTTDVNSVCSFSLDVAVPTLIAGDKIELVFSGTATGVGPRQYNASMSMTALSGGAPPSIVALADLKNYTPYAGQTVQIMYVWNGSSGTWNATYDPSGNTAYPWLITDASAGHATSGGGWALPPYEGNEDEIVESRLTLPCAGVWNHRSYGTFTGVNVGGVWYSNRKTGNDVVVYGTEDQAWHQSIIPVGSYENGSSEWAHKYGSGSGGWAPCSGVEYYPSRIKAP